MTPELKFAHWLRGYMDARRIGQTAIEGLTGQDCSRVYSELLRATNEPQLGIDRFARTDNAYQMQAIPTRAQEQYDKSQADANRLANVFAGQGQTIPTMQEQMQKNEIRPKRDPDCPAHDTRCHQGQCYFQKAEAMGVSYKPKGFA